MGFLLRKASSYAEASSYARGFSETIRRVKNTLITRKTHRLIATTEYKKSVYLTHLHKTLTLFHEGNDLGQKWLEPL